MSNAILSSNFSTFSCRKIILHQSESAIQKYDGPSFHVYDGKCHSLNYALALIHHLKSRSRSLQNAIKTRMKDGRAKPRKRLLDYSIDKYGAELVNETRRLSKLIVLYLPLPFFWALFEQQGSRWTFQASKMNGDIGFYTIQPDQMQMINSLFILVLIPFFDVVVYPVLSKIGIRRPLQKMAIGGVLAAVSFLLSASVQFKIESSPDKTVNMLWLVPQYIVLTMGEVMFSIPGYAFSYAQAPDTMKSVVQSIWHLTGTFGNLMVLFIVKFAFFKSQAHEFLLCAGIMFVDMLIFMTLAHRFKNRI